MQHTLQHSVSVKGIGLHTGAQTELTINPSAINSGIVFWRSDLGEHERARIAPERIRETQLCTGVFLHSDSVMTVEHLLSALCANKIDNALIEVRGPEIPIFDGSAAVYEVLLTEAGKAPQDAPRQVLEVRDIVRVGDETKWAELSPADSLLISFEVDDFNHPYLSTLPHSVDYDVEKDNYWRDIARARTFGFMRDVVFMQERGLALGGTLSNALVFNHETLMNPEGLRFPDEIIRHKVLDALGDLYALGAPLQAHYRAYRSGHALNNLLLRTLMARQEAWRWREVRD